MFPHSNTGLLTLSVGIDRPEKITVFTSKPVLSNHYKSFLENVVVIKVNDVHNEKESERLREFYQEFTCAKNLIDSQSEQHLDDLYVIFFEGHWSVSPLLFNKLRHNFVSLTADNLNLNFYYDITASVSYEWAIDHA